VLWYCIPPSCRRLLTVQHTKNTRVTKTLFSQYYGETKQTCKNVCIWAFILEVQRVGQWVVKSPWMLQYRIFWSRQATIILSQNLKKLFYKLRSVQPKNRCSIPGKDKIFVYTRSVRTGSEKNNPPGWGEVKASISSRDKLNTLRTGDADLRFLHYNCAGRVTQISVFNTVKLGTSASS
jgi:hypothetical protein